jgi:YbgC/YbaW family acyl-CoA thioester hydrolase
MQSALYRHTSEVAFADTDASGWMHFPNIFRYFEQAEHAYLHSRGLLVFDRERGGWPRVSVSCDYKRPLVSGQSVEVLLGIERIGTSSVTWNFQVRCAGETAASGKVITVRVNHQGIPQPLDASERAALSPV